MKYMAGNKGYQDLLFNTDKISQTQVNNKKSNGIPGSFFQKGMCLEIKKLKWTFFSSSPLCIYSLTVPVNHTIIVQ